MTTPRDPATAIDLNKFEALQYLCEMNNPQSDPATAIDWTDATKLEVVDRGDGRSWPITFIAKPDARGERSVHWTFNGDFLSQRSFSPNGTKGCMFVRIRPAAAEGDGAKGVVTKSSEDPRPVTGEEWRDGVREAGGKRWDAIADPDAFIREGRGESIAAVPSATPKWTSMATMAPNQDVVELGAAVPIAAGGTCPFADRLEAEAMKDREYADMPDCDPAMRQRKWDTATTMEKVARIARETLTK